MHLFDAFALTPEPTFRKQCAPVRAPFCKYHRSPSVVPSVLALVNEREIAANLASTVLFSCRFHYSVMV